jgi:hypothetical protein
MSWGKDFAEARRRLIECGDFVQLRRAGHDLKDGVVLTSVSDTPFEMSFKCTLCAKVFWFENLSWRTGGLTDWHFNQEAREAAGAGCVPAGAAVAQLPGDRGPHMHP